MSQAVLMILGDRDRKGKEKQFLWENEKKTKISKNTVDVGIQFEYMDERTMKDMGTQCDIRAEKSTDFYVNCRSRENPGLATSDHGYSFNIRN